MKALKFIAGAALLSLMACGSFGKGEKTGQSDSTSVAVPSFVQAEKTAKDYLPSKGQIDSVSYLIGVNFGSFIKGYNFGDDLNYNQIKKGILDFLAAKGDFRDSTFAKQFRIDPNEINQLFNTFLENRRMYTMAVNKEKEEKFLAKNAKNADVTTTESGLQYTIINQGNDVVAGPRDTIYVHYKGTLLDGTVFDETKNEQPSARLIMNRVVKGWTEGLQLVGEGGNIKLYVPSRLGYGERGNNGIEPNATLIFEVQVDSVKHYIEPVLD